MKNIINEKKWILELRGVTKKYPGVTALNNVSFKVEKGSIHSLVGENGAGKSTLLKVISGVIPSSKFEGNIIFDGSFAKFTNVKQSENHGIAIIHQELAISPHLTVFENMFIGHYSNVAGVTLWNNMRIKAQEFLDKVGFKKSIEEKASNLSIAEQQLLEIAKALSKNAKLIIFDEPTSSLNDEDAFRLLDIMKDLKNEMGITCIFVSHKLKEVAYVSDSITVIRDGEKIVDYNNTKKQINEKELIKNIVGRDMKSKFPERSKRKIGKVIFEAKKLKIDHHLINNKRVVHDASFDLRQGEVIGISGLVGSGRSELLMNIFGNSFGIRKNGDIKLNGETKRWKNPNKAIKDGFVYASENRKEEGLIQIFSIHNNINSSSSHIFSKMGIILRDKELTNSRNKKYELSIKVPNIFYNVETLSGGNQQKVLLAKALSSEPSILVIDEPTKGIDVGSKYEIYKIIQELAAKGKSIILISSEVEELLGTTDRIFVMSQGVIKGQIKTDIATPEKIMEISIGGGNYAE